MASPIITKYVAEIKSLINRQVVVQTIHNHRYQGRVVALNPENLTLVLSDVVDAEGNSYPLVAINGSSVSEILLTQRMFDLRALAERLERYFPRMVKYDEMARVIIVANTVKVDENGVIEGSGPVAERVKSVYDEYVKELTGK